MLYIDIRCSNVSFRKHHCSPHNFFVFLLLSSAILKMYIKAILLVVFTGLYSATALPQARWDAGAGGGFEVGISFGVGAGASASAGIGRRLSITGVSTWTLLLTAI